MSTQVDWKKAAKMNWETTVDSGNFPGMEEVKIGVLMRIADSLEGIDNNLRAIRYDRSSKNRDFENLRKRVSKISKSLKFKP